MVLDEPLQLPYCRYPGHADSTDHGIQHLPTAVPVVDLALAEPHRSNRYAAIPASDLTPAQILDMARVVGASFALREPQVRHLRPSVKPPAGLMQARHIDPFGIEFFGSWTKQTLMYWVVRLLVLTDPTAPKGEISVNDEALAQSIALAEEDGQVVGGAFNETMGPFDITPDLRADDPFLASVMAFTAPIFGLFDVQDTEALTALITRYPDFRNAYESSKVGHLSMVARSDRLPKADTFELVASTVERYQALGYAYIVVEAANQWTGAACEALSGVRVHFAPFRAQPVVHQSHEPIDGVVTSTDGYLSNKDSGSMFYVLRLRG